VTKKTIFVTRMLVFRRGDAAPSSPSVYATANVLFIYLLLLLLYQKTKFLSQLRLILTDFQGFFYTLYCNGALVNTAG